MWICGSREESVNIPYVCLQFLFNFCSCSAVAAAAMNAGGNALLNTGLVMAAHMVRNGIFQL